jgi:flagellar export protein FliJ
VESKKLKRILELKRRIEQAKKGELASARHELDSAQMQLLNAQSEQQARLAALEGEQEVSVTELSDRARFVVLAGQQVGAARAVVAQRDQVVAQREEDRVVATRDVRTFEILNEKDREEKRVVARNVEQRAADDLASSRWSPRS